MRDSVSELMQRFRLEPLEDNLFRGLSEANGQSSIFGGLVAGAGALDPKMAIVAVAMSVAGASLARPVLERLTDGGYRAWAGRLLTTIAVFYLGQGAALFLT